MPRQSISVGDLLGAKAFKAALETTDTNFQELYNAPTVEYVDTVADFPLAISGRLIQTKGLNSAGDGGGRLYQNDLSNTDAVDGVTVVESQAVLPGINTDDIEVPNSWITGGLPYEEEGVEITDHDSQTRDVVEFVRPTETAIAYSYYIKADESEVGYAFSVEVWIAPTGDNRVSLSLFNGSSHRVTSAEILSGSATVSISSGIANVVGVAAGFHKLKISTTYSDVDRILVYPFDASSGESGPLTNHLYGWAFSFGKWVEIQTATGEAGSVSAAVVDTVSNLPYAQDGAVYQTKGLSSVNDGGAKLYISDSASTLTVDGRNVIAVTKLPNANTDDINAAASWSSNGTTIDCLPETITDHKGDTVEAIEWTRLTDTAAGSNYYFKADQSETGLAETVVEFWLKGVGTNRCHISLYDGVAHSVTSVEVLSGSASASVTGGGFAEITGIVSGFHKIRVASTNPDVNRMSVYPFDSSSGESGPISNILYDITPVLGKYIATDTLKEIELVANSDDGAGSAVSRHNKHVEVTGVTTDSSDWIRLPSTTLVGNAHNVVVSCNAASGFKIRSATSETINGVVADLTGYDATDGSLVSLTKVNGGWIAVPTSSDGSVGEAVVESVETKTTSHTLTAADSVIFGDASSDDIRLFLPVASTVSSKRFTAKKISGSNSMKFSTLGRAGDKDVDLDAESSWSDNGTSIDVTNEVITDHLGNASRSALKFDRLTTAAVGSSYYFNSNEATFPDAVTFEAWIYHDGANADSVYISLFGSTHLTDTAEVLIGAATPLVSSGIARFTGLAVGYTKVRVTAAANIKRVLVYPIASGGTAPANHNILYDIKVLSENGSVDGANELDVVTGAVQVISDGSVWRSI
jgi:hypothetical protein